MGLVLAALSGVALPARAEPAAVVTSSSPRARLRFEDAPSTTRVVTRLAAELKVAGFEVELAPNLADSATPAYAEVQVSVENERVRLEITSRATAASSHVVLVGTVREGPALALQATEFLRAGLLPRVVLPESPSPPPERHQVDLARPSPAVAAKGRAFLDVGGAWLTNLRAKDSLWLLSVGAGYSFPERLSLGVGLGVPLGGATWNAARGAADYRLWLGVLHADYAFLRFPGGQATFGLGLGVARVTSSGRPGVPLEGLRPSLWTLSLDARLAAELHVTSQLSLVARTRVATLSPNPVVAVLEEERRLGAPALLFELGARLGGRAQDGAGAFKR